MWVDGEAVGEVGAAELVPLPRGEDRRAAPGRVHVHPEPEFAADGGDGLEGVEGPQDCRPRRRVHVQRRLALAFGLEDGASEGRGRHAA